MGGLKNQFEVLVKVMKSYDLYQNDDEVGEALSDLKAMIIEVEKRLECALYISNEINNSISDYTVRVDNGDVFKMRVEDHDKISQGSIDINKVLNLSDKDCINGNWYGLFVDEVFTNFESSWGDIECDGRGVVIGIIGDEVIHGERNYLYDIKRFDLVEYGKFLESKNLTMGESNDILAVGYWKKNGEYVKADEKWRNGDNVDNVVPTAQCRNTHTFDKVKEVIQILKTLDNGNCVDVETMEYILNEVGISDEMFSKLLSSRSVFENEG